MFQLAVVSYTSSVPLSVTYVSCVSSLDTSESILLQLIIVFLDGKATMSVIRIATQRAATGTMVTADQVHIYKVFCTIYNQII